MQLVWIALGGLHKIVPLFAVERALKLAGDTADERRQRRQRETKPILDDLRAWIDDRRAIVPPKTPLGRALGYLHRQWKRLLLFLADGNLDATNNRGERELRRLIVGRKNWLFTWLDIGGERTAAILSIIATCIEHDVNPRAYLHVVTRLVVAGWPHRRLRELLPDRDRRPAPRTRRQRARRVANRRLIDTVGPAAPVTGDAARQRRRRGRDGRRHPSIRLIFDTCVGELERYRAVGGRTRILGTTRSVGRSRARHPQPEPRRYARAGRARAMPSETPATEHARYAEQERTCSRRRGGQLARCGIMQRSA